MAGPHSPGKRGQTDPGEEKEASESTKSSVEGKPSGARGWALWEDPNWPKESKAKVAAALPPLPGAAVCPRYIFCWYPNKKEKKKPVYAKQRILVTPPLPITG